MDPFTTITAESYTPQQAAQLPALTLAYLGDAIYELKVREHVIKQGLRKVGDLHRQTVAYVRAERQSRLYGELEALLTEEEAHILRHGRNAKSGHQPPHTSVGAYRRATGIETLIGYLYLSRQEERLEQLLQVLFREPLEEAANLE